MYSRESLSVIKTSKKGLKEEKLFNSHFLSSREQIEHISANFVTSF